MEARTVAPSATTMQQEIPILGHSLSRLAGGKTGAKPGKRSPENHEVWNAAQLNKCKKQRPREPGDHDIFLYYTKDQDGIYICMD
eukprot:8113818-Heterocapsa_arctica.AAC.1